MKKEKQIDIATVIGFILLGLFACWLLTGCKSVQQYKYYESGQISEAFYSSEFRPAWSEKESIIKTGNIGLSL